jgi:RNA polymerase sigma factor (sigma-70 family)
MSNSSLDTVVRHIRRMAMGTNYRECSDAQLLQQFVSQRDDAAFTALVRRHENLVWRVCWHALAHVQDTEDAFQATFVVLAHSAAKIDKREMLGSWLHGVALRIALKAKRDAARRRRHEREAANVPKRKQVSELSWREVCQVLDEEVQRLPEKYRTPFVLCVLEEKSLAEAARLLGWKLGTVSGRLSRARKQLQDRLTRREIRLSAVVASLALTHSAATASVPAGLSATTIHTALSYLVRPDAAANVLPANVATFVQGAMKPMLSTKIKLAAVMFLAVNCGMAGVALSAREPADARLEEDPPAAKTANTKADAAAKPARDTKTDTIALSGRVLDPSGKPVAGAKVYLLHSEDGKAPPKVQATSDANGRFRFTIAHKDVQLPPYRGNRWDHVFLCAMAEGHGPALAPVGKPEAAGEHTLQLVKDDVPIRGSLLDLQGKAVSGATVRLLGLLLPNKADLATFVEALKASKDGYPVENEHLTHPFSTALAQLFVPASTDAGGRFQLGGIGRERIAVVEISGPTIETRHVRVMTRPGGRIDRLEWKGYPTSGRLTYYGASFDHVAGPTTPITGVVRDKETKKPLAGAIVTSWKLPNDSLHGRTFIRTTTDKDGRYRLVGMPRGEGSMVNIMGPEGQPYLEVKMDVPPAQGLESVAVDAELKRGVWIKGRVTDKATGKPVSSSIDYFAFADNPDRKDAPGFEPRLHTKADGTFQFIGLPGRGVIGARGFQDKYLVGVGSEKFKVRDDPASWRTLDTSPVRCMVDNYHTLVEAAPAKDAVSLTCDITLDPGRTLTGTVVGPNGEPLPGARLGGVTGFIISSWEHTTQPTAEFAVYAVKEGQKRYVLVLHEEKQLAGSLMLQGDEKGPLTIQLKPWAAVSGRLVASDGQPRPNAEVTLERYGEKINDPCCGYHRIRSFQTDKDGKFRIDALVPGLKYTMRFKTDKGVLSGMVFEDLILQSGEMKELGDVRVKE